MELLLKDREGFFKPCSSIQDWIFRFTLYVKSLLYPNGWNHLTYISFYINFRKYSLKSMERNTSTELNRNCSVFSIVSVVEIESNLVYSYSECNLQIILDTNRYDILFRRISGKINEIPLIPSSTPCNSPRIDLFFRRNQFLCRIFSTRSFSVPYNFSTISD